MTEPTEKELDNFEQELMMEEQDELPLPRKIRLKQACPLI